MKNLIIYSWGILLIIFMTVLSCKDISQSDKNISNKVDSLFQKWDNNNTPGAAVAILKDGELILKKGYGMANLEHSIPISSSTIFHIASDSKQFTNFCIVLLEQQGKLSLEDDIRKFLPELPDFGTIITLKNLIYHTSGLRDQWQLLTISGTRLDDVIKQDHIIKLIKSQRRLNFDPGEEQLYCNTGYTLLAEIVKKVSGQSLREFADKEIFQPLGMKDTHFHDNYKEIVRNRASSYDQRNSTLFENSILSYSTVGATSLFTTVEDAAKWLNNFTTCNVGGQNAIKKMYELGILNSGDTLKYALGLFIDSYKGWQRIGHGGVDAGFRTYMVRFPEKNLGIIIFGNTSKIDPNPLAMKIADMYLEDKSEIKKIISIDYHLFKDNIGKYCSDEGMVCELIDSTKLWLKFNRRVEELIPFSDTSFSVFQGQGMVTFNKNNKTSFKLNSNGYKQILRKYEPFVLTKANIKEYIGTYRNDEVNTKYEIIDQGDSLILSHDKYEDVKLVPITANQFSTSRWGMRNLNFKRDKAEEIKGFEINSERVLHLYFNKTY